MDVCVCVCVCVACVCVRLTVAKSRRYFEMQSLEKEGIGKFLSLLVWVWRCAMWSGLSFAKKGVGK